MHWPRRDSAAHRTAHFACRRWNRTTTIRDISDLPLLSDAGSTFTGRLERSSVESSRRIKYRGFKRMGGEPTRPTLVAHSRFLMVNKMEQAVTEKMIRERAYELWVANGSLEGQSEVNWLAAEQEILAACTARPSQALACSQAAPKIIQASAKTRKRLLSGPNYVRPVTASVPKGQTRR